MSDSESKDIGGPKISISLVKTFEKHGKIQHTTFSSLYFPIQKRVVAGSQNGTVTIYDYESAKELKTIKGYSGAKSEIINHTLKFDDHIFLTAGYDCHVNAYSVDSMEKIKTLVHLPGNQFDQLEKLSDDLILAAPNNNRQEPNSGEYRKFLIIRYSTCEVIRKIDVGRTHHDVKLLVSHTIPNTLFINTYEDYGPLVQLNYEKNKIIRKLENHTLKEIYWKIYAMANYINKRREEMLVCSGTPGGMIFIYNVSLSEGDPNFFIARKLEKPERQSIYYCYVYKNRYLMLSNIEGGIRILDLFKIQNQRAKNEYLKEGGISSLKEDGMEVVKHDAYEKFGNGCKFEIKVINKIVSEKAIEVLTCSTSGKVEVYKISNVLVDDDEFVLKDLRERLEYLFQDFVEDGDDDEERKNEMFFEIKCSNFTIRPLKILLLL